MLWFRRPLIEVVAAGDAARARFATTAAFAASAQQHDVIANNVGHVFLLTALFVVPRVGSDAAFNVDLAALLQILSSDFGEPLPQHDVVPLGAVLPLAV